MQALCKPSNTATDIHCNVCGQGFALYWSRTSLEEREAAREKIAEALALHHATTDSAQAHPRSGFNVPEWQGLARFSGAALLGGAEAWAI
jgi:hypothetical protein